MPRPVQIILGKFIAATSIAKLTARGMSGIKLLDIHNSSVSKNLCWNFCLFFNLFCLFVFSIQHSFLYSAHKLYSAHLCNDEVVVLLMVDCVDNENEGKCNFNTWQRRNRTKSQYSSKLQRCWGPEDP